MKKKILFVNTTLNWGSTGRITEQLATTAIENGFDCIIAHGSRYVRPSSVETYNIGNKLSDYVHVIKSMVFGQHGTGSRIATFRFIKEIKRIKPDIIHLHNIHGYYVNYPMLFNFLRDSKIPVVWTLHDCWTMTGHCTHFDHIGCEKWKEECHDCQLKKNDYKSFLFDRSKANYRLKKNKFMSLDNLNIVTVSKWLAGVTSTSFLSKYPIRYIYNGIDTSIFQYTKSNIKQVLGVEGKYLLLGVATEWDINKGLYDYIELSKHLSDKYQIAMIGVDKSVERILPSNIIGIERTQDIQELVKYYSAADIVLNLSYLETFGMTTVEGMSCGTPSIVYNKTASPELITPDTGQVVQAGNIPLIISAIDMICSKGREYYSEACRQHVIEKFEKNKNAQLYMELYSKLISNES